MKQHNCQSAWQPVSLCSFADLDRRVLTCDGSLLLLGMHHKRQNLSWSTWLSLSLEQWCTAESHLA
jgi:hypothetical protein